MYCARDTLDVAREATALAYPLIFQISGYVGNLPFPTQPVCQQAANRLGSAQGGIALSWVWASPFPGEDGGSRGARYYDGWNPITTASTDRFEFFFHRRREQRKHRPMLAEFLAVIEKDGVASGRLRLVHGGIRSGEQLFA